MQRNMLALQQLTKFVFRQSSILNNFLEQGSFYVARVHWHCGDDFPRARTRIVAVAAPLVDHRKTASLERSIDIARRA
jgi:hypothetical protein